MQADRYPPHLRARVDCWAAIVKFRRPVIHRRPRDDGISVDYAELISQARITLVQASKPVCAALRYAQLTSPRWSEPVPTGNPTAMASNSRLPEAYDQFHGRSRRTVLGASDDIGEHLAPKWLGESRNRVAQVSRAGDG